MRNKIKYYMITLTIAIIAIAIYFLKGNAAKNSIATVKDLEPITKKVNGINLVIDPRIELLATVQAISGYDEKYDLITNKDFTYKNDIKNYFSEFSKHEAVKTFDNMSSSGFTYDAPPTVMLYLSNPLSLNVKQDFSDYLNSRVGEGSLNKFTVQIRKFAVDTKFDEFFNKHKDFYKSVIKENAKTIGNSNYIDNLEQYYGMRQNSYNIILSSMFSGGGFGPRVKNKNGNYDVYSIQGTISLKNNIPIFGDESGFRYVALHEFSHSFVNPLAEENRDKINSYSKLFYPISEKMSKQAYGNWETCVNEHIVRAVMARLTYIHSGKEAYDKMINMEKMNGFFYIEALAKKLEEYESSSDKYKNFKDFYPNLIDVFNELSKMDLGKDFYVIKFNGPISGIAQMNNPLTIILPTNEKDKKLQEDIDKGIKELWGKYQKENNLTIDIISDKEALNEDLKDKNIIVYGTIEGNLYLNKYKSSYPFKIEEDKLIADKEYAGTDYRLITTLPSPANRDNAMLVYTAQKQEGIQGINNILHSDYIDYFLADEKVEVKSGNYIKENGKWSFK